MAHRQQREFVRIVANHYPSFFNRCKVLEVGSLNVNGTVRDFFRDCHYVGLDVEKGKDVDVVCEGQDYDAPDGRFDTVISCESMEHNPFWAETLSNMVRLCRPGGALIVTCATVGRAEHGTARSAPGASPLTVGRGWNYYRNLTPKDLSAAVSLDRAFPMHTVLTNYRMFDLYFCGIKAGQRIDGSTLPAWLDCIAELEAYVRTLNARRVCRYRSAAARVFGDRYFQAVRKAMRHLRADGKTARLMDYWHNWVED